MRLPFQIIIKIRKDQIVIVRKAVSKCKCTHRHICSLCLDYVEQLKTVFANFFSNLVRNFISLLSHFKSSWISKLPQTAKLDFFRKKSFCLFNFRASCVCVCIFISNIASLNYIQSIKVFKSTHRYTYTSIVINFIAIIFEADWNQQQYYNSAATPQYWVCFLRSSSPPVCAHAI